jgi:anaerobic selenocysteine-containing dehydrogenase
MAIQQLHTYCAMCISRCGVMVTVEDGLLKQVRADAEHPNGCICVKGSAAPEIVHAPDRLRYPMVRTRPKGELDPGWARISWDEALALAASRLLDTKARYGPEAVVFSRATPAGSATADLEGWVHRLAHAFGSPNVMTTTHICTWNRRWGSKYTYGVPTPSPDYEHTRCMLLWGYNPEASEPAAALRISRARARGAKLIVIDPRKHSLAEKADCWLRVRPGTDGALALAMIHVLLEEGLYDATFVREWTNGVLLVREDTQQLLTDQDLAPSGHPETFLVWDNRRGGPIAYRADRGYGQDGVEPSLSGSRAVTLADGRSVSCRPAFEWLRELAARYAPERSEAITWVPADDVRRTVRLFAMEQPSCYATWVGLEQHTNAMQTNRAVCLFYALTGQFDRRGSNVLFASTPTNTIMGGELLPREKAALRLGYAEHPLGPPSDPGIVQAAEVYRAILTGQPYPVKAMVLFGSDPLLAHGDPLRGKAALESLDFYVHVDMFANPSAMFADLLLPACTCWECEALRPSFGGAEDTATWVQLRPAVVPPLPESRPDLEILFDLATRLGVGQHFFDGDVEAAFNFQLAPTGVTVQQLRAHPLGMRVEAHTRYQKYAELDAQTGHPRGFLTPSRKVEIYATRFARAGYAPLPVSQEPVERPSRRPEVSQEYPLALTFFRLVQFCDQQHRNIPRLRRQVPDPFLEIHPSTAKATGIEDGAWVVLETAMGRVRLKAKFRDSLHPQVVTTQYGWWQGCQELDRPGYDPFGPDGANVNLLIPNEAIDPISGSVPHRSQRCRVRKEEVPATSALELRRGDIIDHHRHPGATATNNDLCKN